MNIMDSHQYIVQKCTKFFIWYLKITTVFGRYLEDSIFSVGSNPCNPKHLLNTLKREGMSELMLPSSANADSFSSSSVNFFIHFHYSCSFVLVMLKSDSSSLESSSGGSCVTAPSIGRFIDIKLDLTVFSCVECLMSLWLTQPSNSKQSTNSVSELFIKLSMSSSWLLSIVSSDAFISSNERSDIGILLCFYFF